MKKQGRILRALSTRRKISKLNINRFSFYKSNKNFYCQIYSVLCDEIILSVSTIDVNLKDYLVLNFGINRKFLICSFLGRLFSLKVFERKINYLAFDRSGYKYHGLVKTFVYFSRKYGLIF